MVKEYNFKDLSINGSILSTPDKDYDFNIESHKIEGLRVLRKSFILNNDYDTYRNIIQQLC